MKIAMIIILSIICLGCGIAWVEEQRPETPEERLAVAQLEKEILSKIPHTLSGHDQDWDDVIMAAHKIAVKTFCKSRLYERDGWSSQYTGNRKETK